MQIVIELDEEIIEWLNDGVGLTDYQYKDLIDAITNSTPLPKGHGRLGDLDRVRAKIFNASMDEHFMPIKSLTCDDVTGIIDDIPTIIEADKEKQNGTR